MNPFHRLPAFAAAVIIGCAGAALYMAPNTALAQATPPAASPATPAPAPAARSSSW